MMMSMRVVILAVAALGMTGAARAQVVDGAAVFKTRCASCHEPAVDRAPGRAELAARPAADIVTTLTRGVMAPMAQGLSAEDVQAVARWLTAAAPAHAVEDASPRRILAAPLGPASADPKCAGPAPPVAESGSDWPAAGRDALAGRFQPSPGFTAAQAARLKPKWAFSMSGGGQPTVVGRWLFVSNRSGRFYALDAAEGCVRWSRDGLVSRTAPLLTRSPRAAGGWAVQIGLADRTVLAMDAANGAELWRSPPLASHRVAVLTGSLAAAPGRILVPISSLEEVAAMNPAYPCCSFRGAVAALDPLDGHLLWRTEVIDEPVQTLHPKPGGGQVSGPAGGAIWSQPAVDVRRGLVYVATGDSYTDAATRGADAIVALDLKTGAVRWKYQATAADNFVMGCERGNKANCPTPLGPDFDFGATPVLIKAGDHEVLTAGQKSGWVYGLDPDSGAQLWRTRVGAGSALGGVEWGIGTDGTRLLVPVADFAGLLGEALGWSRPSEAPPRPGLNALDPKDGHILWTTPAPKAPCVYATASSLSGKTMPCMRAQSAAPAQTPGLVFSGTADGWIRAYDAATGRIVWEWSTTAQTWKTLNGVAAQPGGSIDGMGPTIAGGRVYVMSGFNGASRVGGNGVNVLIAFSVDGR